MATRQFQLTEEQIQELESASVREDDALTRRRYLAVRLYGNIMSGTVIVGILLSLTPFFFPIVMQLLGLLTGMIQAYIFAILAMVYIASASAAGKGSDGDDG